MIRETQQYSTFFFLVCSIQESEILSYYEGGLSSVEPLRNTWSAEIIYFTLEIRRPLDINAK